MTSVDQNPALSELTAKQRADAMEKYALLQPHLENNFPLAAIARNAAIPIRTVQRWLARYLAAGLLGLVRNARADSGMQKLKPEIIAFIEGMTLQKTCPSIATIHRRVTAFAKKQGWPSPAYSSVYLIVRRMKPALLTLAREGPTAFRNQYEMIYRHRAERPNAIWQADHTELDILILDANGDVVRPWLTTVLDDYSRVVAGYTVFLGAPSALQTSLALRQAIWRKSDPNWPVCGIPDVLHVDHGSDFTSLHLEQVAADLHFQLVYSTVGRPQGRGKIERLFGTINTELLTELPGHLSAGKSRPAPKLSLAELDTAIGQYIINIYNTRKHSSIDESPLRAWLGNGWLPRLPESLEDLDLLLIMMAKPRVVRRDGIHFQGLRYLDPTLVAYVGETITIRYDPRDLAEIRVFHRNRFLCRAVCQEYAGLTISLKDIQTARVKHRHALRHQINERIKCVAEYLPEHTRSPSKPESTTIQHNRQRSKLRTYSEDIE